MPETNTPSWHQRPASWTRGNSIAGAVIWTFIVLMTFVWTHRDAIIAWLITLR
ncbi:MAG TPA: hypothetical protein VFD70_27855 [Anaerolineae bacterium]|nr:hypothetical protein [Anaerolineae bacterium]